MVKRTEGLKVTICSVYLDYILIFGSSRKHDVFFKKRNCSRKYPYWGKTLHGIWYATIWLFKIRPKVKTPPCKKGKFGPPLSAFQNIPLVLVYNVVQVIFGEFQVINLFNLYGHIGPSLQCSASTIWRISSDKSIQSLRTY